MAQSAAPQVEHEPDEMIVRMAEIWRDRAKELQSVEIEYLWYLNGDELQPMDRETFRTIFEAIDFTNEDEGMRTFISSLQGKARQTNSPPLPRHHFISSGGNSRSVLFGGKINLIKTSDGLQIEKRPRGSDSETQQITIGSAPGQLQPYIPGLADFITMPPLRLFEISTITEISPGKARLTPTAAARNHKKVNFFTEYEIDSETGDIISEALYRSRDAGKRIGEIVQEKLGRGFFDVPTGGRFPKVHVRVHYREGLPVSVDCRVIIDVKTSIDTPDDTFHVAANSGDIVIDHVRGDGTAEETETAVRDTISRAHPLQKRTDRNQSQYHYNYMLWFINAIALIFLGIILYRRSRKKS